MAVTKLTMSRPAGGRMATMVGFSAMARPG